MKPKKITTSHMIVYITWLFTIVITCIILNFIFKNSSSITTPVATILGSIVGLFNMVAGYVTKWYFKKSEAENAFKLSLATFEKKLKLVIRYPQSGFKVTTNTLMQNEFDALDSPINKNKTKIYEDIQTADFTK